MSLFRARRSDPISLFAGIGLGLTLLLTVVVSAITSSSPLLAYAASVTFTTFLFCGYDKAIAGRDKTRVPERVLYLLAFIGGSLGLLLGMKFFRHKTRKPRFRFYLLLVLTLQVALLLWAAGQWKY